MYTGEHFGVILRQQHSKLHTMTIAGYKLVLFSCEGGQWCLTSSSSQSSCIVSTLDGLHIFKLRHYLLNVHDCQEMTWCEPLMSFDLLPTLVQVHTGEQLWIHQKHGSWRTQATDWVYSQALCYVTPKMIYTLRSTFPILHWLQLRRCWSPVSWTEAPPPHHHCASQGTHQQVLGVL